LETKLLLFLFVVFFLLLLLFFSKGYVKRLKILFFKKHVIIIGLSRIGVQVALNLAKEGRKVVVISMEPLGPEAEYINTIGGFVISYSGIDESVLAKAGLAKANTLFIATNDDDTNIKLAQFVSRLKKRKYIQGSLKLMLHINDFDLKNLLSDYLDVSSNSAVDVQPFNINDITAQFIYDQFPPHLYLIDETSKDNEKIICIVGDNEIARSFLIENSILSQYGEGKKLKIFLISGNADSFYNSVIRQYPNVIDFLEIVPIELRNDNFSSTHEWDSQFLKAIHAIDAVYFFGNKDAKLINSALHFRQFLYEKTMNIRKVPIIVCLPEETKVVNMLNGEGEKSGKPSLTERFKNQVVIHFVRKYSDTCSVKQMIDVSGENEVLAKSINYYYAIKYEFDGLLNIHFKKSANAEFINRLEREMIGFKVKRGEPLAQIEQLVLDFTKEYTKNSIEKIRSIFGVNQLWNNLTDRKKESNRYVARHLDVKFYVLKKRGIKTFTKDEIKLHLNYLAKTEHDRWSAEKFAFDFSYGSLPGSDKNLKKILKDTLKIHDQLIPFEKLDQTNKEKDLDMFMLLPLLQSIKENIKD
jgi:hypothetical protein